MRSYRSVAARTKPKPSPITSVEAGIVERAAMHGAKVLARDVDHGSVDLDERHRLDRRMLEQLLGRSAVAAADDQRALGLRMRKRCQMNEVLVIEELVAFGRHEMAVEAEQLAERHAVVDLDRLIRRTELLEPARRSGCRSPTRR